MARHLNPWSQVNPTLWQIFGTEASCHYQSETPARSQCDIHFINSLKIWQTPELMEFAMVCCFEDPLLMWLTPLKVPFSPTWRMIASPQCIQTHHYRPIRSATSLPSSLKHQQVRFLAHPISVMFLDLRCGYRTQCWPARQRPIFHPATGSWCLRGMCLLE